MTKKIDLMIAVSHLLNKNFDVEDNMAVAVSEQKIIDIGLKPEMYSKYEPQQMIDGEGKVLMPGLVDAHTHSCQQFLRGRIADEPPMIWARILVPFESSLLPEDVYASGRQCCVEMIKSGITSFADSGGSYMEEIAKAVEEIGNRGIIARSTMDTGSFVPDSMKDTVEDAIKKTEELYKEFNNRGDERIKIWFALRQAMTSTPELIMAVNEKSKEYNTGIHVHLAEHRAEVDHCLINYRMRPGEWFDSLGIADDRLLAAHSVLLKDSEIKLLAERGVNFIHCPRSNLGSHGFPKTPLIKAMGGNIGLGTDGASGGKLDIFSSMRILSLACSAQWGLTIHDPISLVAKDLLEMATINGAKALGLEDEIGTIEVGKKADMILIDFSQNHLSPNSSITHTIINCAQTTDVSDVIINGKVVLKDGQVLTCDEKEVLSKGKEHQEAIFTRANM